MIDIDSRDGIIKDLYERSEVICSQMGIGNAIILTIHNTERDWDFIMLVDSLIETVSRRFVVAHVDIKNKSGRGDDLFSKMKWDGAVSIKNLLKIICFEEKLIKNIEYIRTLRNQFAHDASYIEKSLADVILGHPQKKNILEMLVGCPINRWSGDQEIFQEGFVIRCLILTRMHEVIAAMQLDQCEDKTNASN